MPELTLVDGSGVLRDLPAKLTWQVIVCTVIAACGGLMFGYDIGISGGVTGMDMFLEKFFPEVYVKKHQAKANNYCKFNSQLLQLFTSSLYLAAIVACFIGSICCKKRGRKPTMQIASVFFLVGAILNAAALNIGMLIAGRLCLGAGIGFGNQAVPLFISEIAPARYRGGLNLCFQLLITIGILTANVINYATSKLHPYGWRISLGGAACPALLLLLGSLMIVETPTSLIERGKDEEGLYTLKKIRGVDNVDKEYEEISQAVEFSRQIRHPFKNLWKQSGRPQLVCGALIQIFQQFTGISVVMLYAPVLFQTMGLGENASLMSAIMTNTVKPIGTAFAIVVVDRFGRRALLIEAAIQMFISLGAIGVILAVHLHSTNVVAKHYAVLVIVLVCVFLAAFAWSWGPLGWLIPSEIFPIETRSAGFSVAVIMNFVFTFLVAQTFLTMLCHMRAGTFFLYCAMLAVMCLFAKYFLPETKGIPIDEMVERVWKQHWFWKRYYKDHDNGKGGLEIQDEPKENTIA
ncbi:PREDICTED: sugar transport protein 8 [Populus euphratica]|uniref:Sugar transport protein 8 n=1 Tax=Populus euphratica TaxID=75702 RepID=A0AAJ6UMN5_POPEU|nr:PREDICTED: sugar transport protein 8 [Populus euphratica]